MTLLLAVLTTLFVIVTTVYAGRKRSESFVFALLVWFAVVAVGFPFFAVGWYVLFRVTGAGTGVPHVVMAVVATGAAINAVSAAVPRRRPRRR